MKSDRMVGLLTARDADVDYPAPSQLYEVGTIAKVLHAKKTKRA